MVSSSSPNLKSALNIESIVVCAAVIATSFAFAVIPSPPTTFTDMTGLGADAGQSDYQEFIAQNPQQTATQYSTYTPPEFQGVGSYLTPQQGSYLMYSTPGSVFKRPEGG